MFIYPNKIFDFFQNFFLLQYLLGEGAQAVAGAVAGAE
jgi:hypothetical protein